MSEPLFLTVSLDPDPVIEAYKKDVDRTLIRENLKKSPQQRVEQLMALLRFIDEAHASRARSAR
jgi:hypothetical protein